jgi:peptidoglycan/xylan/chitin deacetylase (PgdA/CDA1 family)
MAALARVFNVLPLDEALDRLAAGSLPARAAAVTFDDGYADNHDVALPILREFGLPATFFVATGTLGQCMWNDSVVEAVRHAPDSGLDTGNLGLGRLPTSDAQQRARSLTFLLAKLRSISREERDQAVSRLLAQAGILSPTGMMLVPDQVRNLRRAGMGIGAHTVRHPILAHIPNEEAEREIGESREALEGILGEGVGLFAYPNGQPGMDYGPEHVAMVRKAGFHGAVSTAWGANRPKDFDPFQIRRFTPWDQTPERFVGRLLWQGLKRQ